MKTSAFGQKTFQTLAVRIDTLAKADSTGRARYKYDEPYGVIRDDFQTLADSPQATDDERALGRLGLRLNNSWAPGAGISKNEVFQAHSGLVSSVSSEMAQPSGLNVGSILAHATLQAIDTAFSATPGMVFWTKEEVASSFLTAGFQSIADSGANRKQKSLARQGLKELEKSCESAMEKMQRI